MRCGEKNIGYARIERVGIRFFVSADVKTSDAAAPFRLAAVCKNRLIPFGVMLPGNGGFTYGKMFTSVALREMGISEIDCFTIIGDIPQNKVSLKVNANSGSVKWEKEDDPGALLEEGEFRRIFSACKDTLVRREKDIVYLAIPVIKGEKFPAMPVFCLGEVRKINDGLYLVFKVYKGKLSF